MNEEKLGLEKAILMLFEEYEAHEGIEALTVFINQWMLDTPNVKGYCRT